jgi:hypothetical protein
MSHRVCSMTTITTITMIAIITSVTVVSTIPISVVRSAVTIIPNYRCYAIITRIPIVVIARICHNGFATRQ